MTKSTPRTPFREWLAGRLAEYAKKTLFKEQRNPQTDEEEEELADVLRGLWARCGILHYSPMPTQQRFHDSRASQIRLLVAPNQHGKTTAGICEILSWGIGEQPWDGKLLTKIGKTAWKPRMRFFIGATDFPAGINEVILPKMDEMLPLKELGVEFTKMGGRITHKLSFPDPFNFSIKFFSYDQEMHKGEGMTWNGGWFDEPPPKHLYISCRRGCLRHAAPIIFSGTLINEPWVYDDLYRNIKSVHVDVKESVKSLKWNSVAVLKIPHDEYPPGVTKEQMEEWALTMDEDEKMARIYGEPLHLEGRVYKTFDSKRHVLDRDLFFHNNPKWRDYPAFCVMDPHDRKPFAIAWGRITPRDEIVFTDEWPSFDFYKQKSWRWSIDQYVEMIRERETEIFGKSDSNAPDNVLWRIMDPNFGKTGKAGMTGTLEEEFIGRGLAFDATVNDNIEEGHLLVKTRLHNDQLFFLSNCFNLIKGMENYIWDEHRGGKDRSAKEKPRDKFKDFPDCVRYVVMSELHYVSPGELLVRPTWRNNGLS